MTTRKSRGAETELRFAEHLTTHGWPWAQVRRGAGSDITGTPGLVWELKARRGFTPLAWLRQVRNHGAGLPVAVIRPDGLGPAHIGGWAMMFTVEDGINLLHAAGYGTPPEQPRSVQPSNPVGHSTP